MYKESEWVLAPSGGGLATSFEPQFMVCFLSSVRVRGTWRL